ncbi:hypothetical protein COMA2_180056 [Candidatus Nitrospira nitrificans]|uniref:Uncharacterized protein n=1 Tax=Candidatus Nitrospira nitrificans TaxID=1742973 RepID=A0A0S4LHT0_9BACT|nr:hypothetical protein COMA2_180056 [Candidatus Nitrospira nitrificans]
MQPIFNPGSVKRHITKTNYVLVIQMQMDQIKQEKAA